MSDKIKILFGADVLFNGLERSANRSGIFFTAHNILKKMCEREDVEITLFNSKGKNLAKIEILKREIPYLNKVAFFQQVEHLYLIASFLKYKKQKASTTFSHYLWHYVRFMFMFISLLPRKITEWTAKYSFDAFLSPSGNVPKVIARKRNLGKFIILYDTTPLLFPQYFPDMQKGRHWLLKLLRFMKSDKKARYFAISENTKKDFLWFVPEVKQEMITVTPLAAGDNFYKEANLQKIAEVRAKYNIPEDKKYVFSLCTLEPRKNLIRVVKTFVEFVKKNQINDMVFVLGGGHWKEFIGKVEAELGKIPEGLVIKAGYIDDEDLAPLYSGAEWFVYTSQYEGFGLPPLEAMQCGTPVITSNTSSLPEVVGDAGIMIDWDSDEQHIKAYEDYYFHPELREQNRQKGLERAKLFSWDNTVNLIIKEINK